MNSFEVERHVDRPLRELPWPRAPHTLLPRVLAATKAWANRPWYTREWFSWPMTWQVASLGLLVATLGAGIALWLPIQLLVSNVTAPLTASVDPAMTEVARVMEISVSTLIVIWRALVQPFLPYAFVIVLLMCGACAMVVFALNRLIFRRTLQS